MDGINPEDLVLGAARQRMYYEARKVIAAGYSYREVVIIEAAARVLAEYHNAATAENLALRAQLTNEIEMSTCREIREEANQ